MNNGTRKALLAFTLRRPLRRGFTLVELLVVIAIIGILVALLLRRSKPPAKLPAAVRAPGNLRQLGIAHLNYESTNRRLAPGNLWRQNEANNSPGPRFTPNVVFLMQYLEEGPRFELYNRDLDWDDQPVAILQALGTPLPTYSAQATNAAG